MKSQNMQFLFEKYSYKRVPTIAMIYLAVVLGCAVVTWFMLSFPLQLYPVAYYAFAVVMIAIIVFLLWQLNGFLARYYVAPDGIHVRYPFAIRERLYAWENKGRFDLCRVTGYKLEAEVAIRFCTRDCPETLQKDYVSYHRALLNRRKMVLILASKERMEELRTKSPAAVTQKTPFDQMGTMEGFCYAGHYLDTLSQYDYFGAFFFAFLLVLDVCVMVIEPPIGLFVLLVMLLIIVLGYVYQGMQDKFARFRLTEQGAKTWLCHKHLQRSFAWDDIEAALEVKKVKGGRSGGHWRDGYQAENHQANYLLLVRKNTVDHGPMRNVVDDEFRTFQLNPNYILLPKKLEYIEFIEQYIPITDNPGRCDPRTNTPSESRILYWMKRIIFYILVIVVVYLQFKRAR